MCARFGRVVADENFLADAAADDMRARLRELASQVVDLQVRLLAAILLLRMGAAPAGRAPGSTLD